MWVPESIWHYNVEGRSATDGGDQLRRKMAMAERRTVRAGHKGIAFVFDIAFSNGAVTWRFLQPRTTPRSKLDREFTKVRSAPRCAPSHSPHSDSTPNTYLVVHAPSQVNFCLRWINETLDVAKPLRRRLSAGMQMGVSGLFRNQLIDPSSCGEQARRPQHELIDMHRVAAQAAQHQGGTGRVRANTSICAYADCREETKRAKYKCLQCKGGEGSFYHVSCFFKCHQCTHP